VFTVTSILFAQLYIKAALQDGNVVYCKLKMGIITFVATPQGGKYHS